jgi:hypothetical protein
MREIFGSGAFLQYNSVCEDDLGTGFFKYKLGNIIRHFLFLA